MLKSFPLTALLSATSILLVAEATFSRPLTTGSQGSVVPDKPVCFIQTANGTTLNLSSLCGKVPENTVPQQSSPDTYQNQNSALQQSNPAIQSCRTKDECLRVLGPDNFPQPLYAPKDGSPAG